LLISKYLKQSGLMTVPGYVFNLPPKFYFTLLGGESVMGYVVWFHGDAWFRGLTCGFASVFEGVLVKKVGGKAKYFGHGENRQMPGRLFTSPPQTVKLSEMGHPDWGCGLDGLGVLYDPGCLG
jgi:hypothetical protein